ncbi:MAG: SxtJ family membrane protein [Rhodospirillales bacterium]|nr:SxtJ family membrane protein [Rhodospirillales bacterium]
MARQEMVGGSTDRAFGLVFVVVLLIIACWPLFDGATPRPWWLATAALLALIAFIRPGLLAPFNRAWTKFGLLLHKIVNPIIMGLVFYLTVTPTGLIMRLLGKDPLRLRFDHEAKSYWIERTPPGPAPETMKQQF